MELLTEKQILRKARDGQIADMFRQMRLTYPNASETRIIAEIAKSGAFGIRSPYGVRNALIKQNVITPKQ